VTGRGENGGMDEPGAQIHAEHPYATPAAIRCGGSGAGWRLR
jgi:hypothetical protein